MKDDGSRPLVSVVMTVYNGARYVVEAVESVLAQSYAPIEIVVYDDGSEDDTVDRLTAFGDRIELIAGDHVGMGAARNRAVEVATGRLLTFLDADDLCPSNRVALQAEVLAVDPTIDVVYGHVREFVSPDLDPERAARLRPASTRIEGRLPTSMLIRIERFHEVGRFAEDLHVGIGMDWSARAAEAGLHSSMLDDVVLERRLHSENNALKQSSQRHDYLAVVKAAVDRRRARSANG